ncbi:AAA family ATPase [Clostridium paridis]|uniref:AAA family ATPase n=1 Tax=Clostridium paridis TaxID=2803863 RepID=A0A937K497_9CLOT|nr:AAA family ATPase [Clostridium paridis]MBL4930960.1 AAA family ATPase [Clostridium paridis]
MKKLVIINGAMGIGKTTTCRELYKSLDNSVWLDGDWCWMINPFVANEENIEMVQKNINYMLNSFLNNSSIEYIVFNWVIHLEEIFESILKNLDNIEYEVYKITLMCSEEGLRKRIGKDVENNLRDEDCINRSLDRLKLYKDMNTIKIDTSDLTVSETVERIKEIINA